MAWLFGDTFDHYTTLDTKWTAASSAQILAGAGQQGTSAAAISAGGSLQLACSPASPASGVWGLALQSSGDASLTEVWFEILSGSTVLLSCQLTETWQLAAYRSTDVPLGTTSVALSGPGTFQYLELLWGLASSGSLQFRLDGTQVLTFTGPTVLTGGIANWDGVRIRVPASRATLYVDNVYLCDTSGAAANTFLGPVYGTVYNVAAVGATQEWTAPSGDKVTNLASLDDGTSVVEAAASSLVDTYTIGTVPSADTVVAVQVCLNAAKDGTGPAQIAATVGAAGVYRGAVVSLTDTWRHYVTGFVPNPETADAWTAGQVSAAEFGIWKRL